MAIGDTQLEQVEAVRSKYSHELLEKRQVLGVSIGSLRSGGRHSDFALLVLVDPEIDPDNLEPEDHIPARLDGVPVIVRPVGSARSQH